MRMKTPLSPKAGKKPNLNSKKAQRAEAKRGADQHDALVAELRENAAEKLAGLTPGEALRAYLQAFAMRFKKEVRAGSQEAIALGELEFFRGKMGGKHKAKR
jgi:hypothetical protein